MGKVSESGEEILVRLVEWEMFGREDVEPKMLLEDLSLTDLATVSDNLSRLPDAGSFVTPQMVSMELMFRRKLIGAWNYLRDGDHVRISVRTNQSISFIPINFSLSETCS
jgi:hypothetical protein